MSNSETDVPLRSETQGANGNDKARGYVRILWRILALIALFALWQYAGSKSEFARVLISTPSKVLRYVGAENYALSQAAATTLVESAAGLLLATFTGLGLVIVGLYFPAFLKMLMPGMIISQVIPLVSLAPLFVIAFGFGVPAKIAMATLISVFPVFVNFVQGVRLVPEGAVELFDVNNASQTMLIRYLYFPLSLPSIFAGLKVASTLSVIGAIVAEFTGADAGLGKNLYLACKKLEPELMVCSIALSSFIGLAFFWMVKQIEKRLVYWR